MIFCLWYYGYNYIIVYYGKSNKELADESARLWAVSDTLKAGYNRKAVVALDM